MKAVILAGGIGSRLWPLSRDLYPKQLLQLLDNKTLLQHTVDRAVQLGMTEIIVVTMHHFRFYIQEQIDALYKNEDIHIQIILEPCGRNTAPAIALAAFLSAPDEPLFIMPADHMLEINELSLRMHEVSRLAQRDFILTFGIKPTIAHTGYGYIQSGSPLPDHDNAFSVESFVEKPDLATAQSYLSQECYLWNSGMLCIKAGVYLSELKKYNPAIHEACKTAFNHRFVDLSFIKFSKDSYEKCPNISVDYAIMEHTQRALTLPLACQWSDLGSWASLYDFDQKDCSANSITGPVIAKQSSGCLLHASKRLLAVAGVDDLVVVDSPDAILVAKKNNEDAFNEILDELKTSKREERIIPKKVFRPWGSYEILLKNPNYEVRLVHIIAGKSIALHTTDCLSKHWKVIKGAVEVKHGDQCKTLCLGEGLELRHQHELTCLPDSDTLIIETTIQSS